MLNNTLRQELQDEAVEIEKDIKDARFSTGKSYKFAVFHFKNEEKKVEVRFVKDPDKLTNPELLELGVNTEEDRRYFNSPDHPALRGVWFVDPDKSCSAPPGRPTQEQIAANTKHQLSGDIEIPDRSDTSPTSSVGENLVVGNGQDIVASTERMGLIPVTEANIDKSVPPSVASFSREEVSKIIDIVLSPHFISSRKTAGRHISKEEYRKGLETLKGWLLNKTSREQFVDVVGQMGFELKEVLLFPNQVEGRETSAKRGISILGYTITPDAIISAILKSLKGRDGIMRKLWHPA